ncbi:hypothetical protein ACC675_37605, partial [Rhizobium ruizarguesonis]
RPARRLRGPWQSFLAQQRVSQSRRHPRSPADAANVEALNQKIAELTGQVDQLRSTLAQSYEQQTTNGADIAKRLEEAEKKLN